MQEIDSQLRNLAIGNEECAELVTTAIMQKMIAVWLCITATVKFYEPTLTDITLSRFLFTK